MKHSFPHHIILLSVLLLVFTFACNSSEESDGMSARPGYIMGEVLETMDSGGYTYVRVESDGADVWAAAPVCEVAVGDSVEFATAMPMTDYHSKTMDRTFDLLYFAGSLAAPGSEAVAGSADAPAGMQPSHGRMGESSASGSPHEGMGTHPVAEAGPIDVEPLDGGLTVAQVFSERQTYAGKQIRLRGQVVKFNGGIMGRNWLHIQDGSGETGTNDLTVTSQDHANVGDVVVVDGVLVLDQDFGYGYVYDLLIEEASVTAK